ncbi:MAG: sulfatase [Deltaproteobacteria bacterium]|nr:sulfatase [Deltaproteobacteria bacterium]
MRELIRCRGALPVREPRADSRRRSVEGSAWFSGLTVCFALAAVLACGSEPEPPSATLDPSRPFGAVVFLLDTVRADRVSSYGYERLTTPAIDALAERGVLFEQVSSFSSWTLPSAVALLSGDYPALVLDDDMEMQRSLAESLSEAGYRTAAFTEGAFVSRRWGMDRGFRHYHETDRPTLVEKGGSDVEGTFAAASQWLRDNAASPFFMLIHTYEAHIPYRNRDFVGDRVLERIGPSFELALKREIENGEINLTEAEASYIRDLYDSDIRSADRYVGEFVELLAELGLAERTLVVVTSDHGEDMGDRFRGHIGGHGHSLHDDLLLVPLVIHDPTRRFAKRRVDVQVRTLDVLPTVADLLGVALDGDIAGRSLLPVMMGDEAEHRVAMAGEIRRGTARIALRDGRYKYIAAIEKGPPANEMPGPPVPRVQLYDLEADPGETTNLARKRPQLARQLARQLANWFNGLDGPPVEVKTGELDEKLRKRLKALGYTD